MRTYLDCIPCFLKGALEQARLATGNELIHKEVINEAAATIPDFCFGLTPPEMARKIHQIIAKKFGDVDLFKEIKQKSNLRALELYPILKNKINASSDRLLIAIEIAIAGNIIDYAAKNSFNVDEELAKLFSGDLGTNKKDVFEYDLFAQDLSKAKTVLYLADNAGEIVFDKVFIEEFCDKKNVIFAVRDKPAINDALKEDAIVCGIDKITKVISSGVDTPGTVLKYCSKQFLEIFHCADLIISKGQGNYEALSESFENIYFLFKVKCPVIARHSGATLGDIVLLKNPLAKNFLNKGK